MHSSLQGLSEHPNVGCSLSVWNTVMPHPEVLAFLCHLERETPNSSPSWWYILMFTHAVYMLQVWNESEVFLLSNEITPIHRNAFISLWEFKQPCHLERETPSLLHCVMVHLDVHQVHAASLKVTWDSIRDMCVRISVQFYIWAAVAS